MNDGPAGQRVCSRCGMADAADWYCAAHGHCRTCSLATCNSHVRPTVEEQTIPQLLDELYSWANDPRAKPWLEKMQRRIRALEAKLRKATASAS